MKRIIVILLAICFIGSSSFAENRIAYLTDYYADCLDLSSMKGLYLGRRVSETETSDHNSRDQYVCSYPSAYFISGYVDNKPLLAFYNEYAQKVDLYLWNEGKMMETDLSSTRIAETSSFPESNGIISSQITISICLSKKMSSASEQVFADITR